MASSFIYTKATLIQEVHNVLNENVQLMDKHYIKTGILNDNDRQQILDITGGDNYTKFIADMYAFWSKHNRIDDNLLTYLQDNIYAQLKTYDKNILPVCGLDIYNANAELPCPDEGRPMDILNLFSAISERQYGVRRLQKFPSIWLRNLKNDIRKPRGEYGMQEVVRKLKEIENRYDYIMQNNPDNVEKIMTKVFSSKNDTFDKVATYLENVRNYLASDTQGVAGLMEKLKDCPSSKLVNKIVKERIYVVDVGSHEDMQALGCGSTWCFSTSSDPRWWDDYAPHDYAYLIFNFSKPIHDRLRMVVHLSNGEEYDMYNEYIDDTSFNEYIPYENRPEVPYDDDIEPETTRERQKVKNDGQLELALYEAAHKI